MPILIVGVLIVGIFFAQKARGSDMGKRIFDLEDVLPENQGGTFKLNYDVQIEAAADKWGVPFALIKAHAIQESSLNPEAFLDENPGRRPDRMDWASRGLCQVLWWPGSQRLKKYGYADADLGPDGEKLFEVETNVDVAAQIMKANLVSSGGNIRDAINMYNTGKKESVFKAPGNYTDKVYKNYLTLLGKA